MARGASGGEEASPDGVLAPLAARNESARSSGRRGPSASRGPSNSSRSWVSLHSSPSPARTAPVASIPASSPTVRPPIPWILRMLPASSDASVTNPHCASARRRAPASRAGLPHGRCTGSSRPGDSTRSWRRVASTAPVSRSSGSSTRRPRSVWAAHPRATFAAAGTFSGAVGGSARRRGTSSAATARTVARWATGISTAIWAPPSRERTDRGPASATSPPTSGTAQSPASPVETATRDGRAGNRTATSPSTTSRSS